MGSSPIARSIFLFLFLAFFHPASLSAQVESDPSRPFEQGEVVHLFGATAYQGDLPHQIEITEDIPYHTTSGILGTTVGWFGPPGTLSSGLRIQEPGLFFEGIPYPFATLSLLERFPSVNKVEFYDFPAMGWFGPSASSGALQFNIPTSMTVEHEAMSLWGGGGFGGGRYFLQHKNFAFNFNDKGRIDNENQGDLLMKLNLVKQDSLGIDASFLGLYDSLSNDHWIVFSPSLQLSSPNFQRLEFKPYIQVASWNSLATQEAGGFLNYHFNMGGIGESHWGVGFSHAETGSGANPLDKGFIQASNLVDILGMVNADIGCRFDFSSISNPVFGFVTGLQGVQGDITLLGDCAKGVLEYGMGDTFQADVGIRYQPLTAWLLEVKGMYEEAGGGSWHGIRGRLEFAEPRTFLFVLKKTKFFIEGQALLDGGGMPTWDWGIKVQFSFFEGNRIKVRGRWVTGQIFLAEASCAQAIVEPVSAFVSVANLDNRPFSWPDPLSPPGRLLWAGFQGQF